MSAFIFCVPAVGASKAVLGEYLLPTIGENETYYRRKRDLLWEEKRPTMGEKETWFLVRRRQYWASTDRTTCSASAWREFSQVSRSLLLLK